MILPKKYVLYLPFIPACPNAKWMMQDATEDDADLVFGAGILGWWHGEEEWG